MALSPTRADRLSQQTGISQEEARLALEHSGGDLLEAVLFLERTGRLSPPSGGFYSTRSGGQSAQSTPAEDLGRRTAGEEPTCWRDRLWNFLRALVDLLRHCTTLHFEVWRKGQLLTAIPVIILILLLIFAFWIAIPLFLVGLILGCRYRFQGAEVDPEPVNQVLEQASDGVDDVLDRLKREFDKKKK